MNTLPHFLATVIENGIIVEESASSGHGFFAVICLIIGAFNIFFPYGAWYLSQGWKFRDAEPSDLVLTMTRVGGVIAAVIGVIFLFI